MLDFAAFELDGRTWDLFLLVPGAVLGAILGLVATVWWQALKRRRNPELAPGSTAKTDDSVAGSTRPSSSSSASHASATSSAKATSNASSVVRLNQVINVPPPPRDRGSNRSGGDSGPWESVFIAAVIGVAATVTLAAGYAWARPSIEVIYLGLGALGVGLCLTLLAGTLLARVVEGARWIGLLVISTAVSAVIAVSPWLIHGADYPHKDYSEVLRLVASRPFGVSDIYGSIGVKFLLWQLGGVVLIGLSFLLAALVVSANALGVSAVIGHEHTARLALFRRRSFPSLLAALAMSALGAWLTVGGGFRASEGPSYEQDQQDPRIFELSTRATASGALIAFRADEPGLLRLTWRQAGTEPPGKRVGRAVVSGHNRIELKLPVRRRSRTYLVTLQVEDASGRRGPVRTVRFQKAAT